MSARLRALIVDDEDLARRLIREYLNAHPDIDIAGESRNGLEAVADIEALAPDLIFLDIQMPQLSGLEVLEATERFALLSYEHKPDASWPFAFDTSQAFRLTGHELELTLSITNQSASATPVGLGWHPHFVKRARSRIAFEATGRWEMDAQKLPTHRISTHGLDADCALLDVDHCYDGWSGVVHLRDEALDIRVSSNLSRLVVFTSDTKDFVAIEPVSHVNNAINLMANKVASAEALGVHVLQPGESVSSEMTIHVEDVT